VTYIRALYARFRQLIHEAGRFGVVGLAGLAVTDGGANLLTYRAHLNSVAATAVAIVAATAVTFLGSRYWTFRDRERSGARRETVLFFAVNGVGIGITEACVGVTYLFGAARDGLAYNLALIGGIALATLFRYWSYKKWVWPAAQPAPAPVQAPVPALAPAPVPATPARLMHARLWLLAREMGRFVIVGATGLLITATGADLLRFRLGAGPLTSAVIATAAALAVTYTGHRYWTFRHRQHPGGPREVLTFLALNALGLAVQLACIGLTSYVLGLHAPLSYSAALITGIALATLLRYWSYRTWVWPAQPSSPAEPSRPLVRG
jgi:putative flippase GtrA